MIFVTRNISESMNPPYPPTLLAKYSARLVTVRINDKVLIQSTGSCGNSMVSGDTFRE